MVKSNKRLKTVFLSAHHGFEIRYFVYSDILKRLKDYKDLRIVVLTKKGDVLDFLRENFAGENVEFHELELDAIKEYSSKRLFAKTREIMAFVLNAKYDINTVVFLEKLLYQKLCNKGSLLRKLRYWVLTRIPVLLLRRSSKLRRLFRHIVLFFQKPEFHNRLYRFYRPDLFIVGSLGFRTDAYLLHEAKKNNIKTLSVVLNWDNATTKGMSGCPPDNVVVWNEGMKNEVIWHHDVPKENIFIGGAALYDIYYRKETFLPRTKVLERFNLQPDKKIIFYGTMSPTRFPWNPEIVEILARACAEDKFIFPCQLLVRLHPIYFHKKTKKSKFNEEFNRFMAIKNKYGNVYYNIPNLIKPEGDMDGLHPDDMKLLANIIKNSSVLLCFFSTLILEASILDIPVVSLCLEGKSNFWGEEKEVLKGTHLQDVLSSGGVKIAFTEEELIDAINYYLEDPSRDAGGRKKIRENKCGPYPGNSGVMIADYIRKLAFRE